MIKVKFSWCDITLSYGESLIIEKLYKAEMHPDETFEYDYGYTFGSQEKLCDWLILHKRIKHFMNDGFFPELQTFEYTETEFTELVLQLG